MARTKTTEMSSITAAQLADGDLIPVIDVSDTTMSSTGTNKKLAKSQLAEAAGVTAHLADTSDAHDASAISFSATGNLSSTDVQAAIAEVDSDLTAHTGDTSDAHDASAISVLDTAGNYTATDVEAVLAELPSRFAPLADTISIPATLFNVTSGTAGISTIFSVDAVRSFADGAANYVGLNVGRLPAHWTTYNVRIRWCNMLAGAGNVTWLLFVGATGPGDTIGTFASPGAVTAAAAGQFVVVQSTGPAWTGLAVPAAGDDLVITIARAGADGTDTLAAAAGLYAVEITRG